MQELFQQALQTIKSYEPALNLLLSICSFLFGIFFENKVKIVNKIRNQGNLTQSKDERSWQTLTFGFFNRVSVTGDRPAPRVAPPEEALGPPGQLPPPQLIDVQFGSNQEFLCNELGRLFRENGGRFELEGDYRRAASFAAQGRDRPAATLYVRTFQPVVILVGNIGNQAVAQDLSREIEKLESWVLDESGPDTLEEIIPSIERILFKFFSRENSEQNGSTPAT